MAVELMMNIYGGVRVKGENVDFSANMEDTALREAASAGIHGVKEFLKLISQKSQQTKENQTEITAVTDIAVNSFKKVISLLGRCRTGHARFRRAPATTKTETEGGDWKTEEKPVTGRTTTTTTTVVLNRQKIEQFGGSAFRVYCPTPIHRRPPLSHNLTTKNGGSSSSANGRPPQEQPQPPSSTINFAPSPPPQVSSAANSFMSSHRCDTTERMSSGFEFTDPSSQVSGSMDIFECSPARQVWALSKISTNPLVFPTQALFSNLDHLFWRVKPALEDHHFVWILWYIWKGRNNKMFSNLDIDPQETLRLAESESRLWLDAQDKIQQPHGPNAIPIPTQLANRTGRWCFLDGSWKEGDPKSGQGWYSTLEGFEGLKGARNTRPCQSPLHSEMEALILAMECMRNLRQTSVTFVTDCSQLVKIVSTPEEWPAFANYTTDIEELKRSFHRSELIHILRTHNLQADRLAQGARKQSS